MCVYIVRVKELQSMGMQIWVLLCYVKNRYLFMRLEIVVIQVGYTVIQVYHFGVTVHWYSGRQLITST